MTWTYGYYSDVDFLNLKVFGKHVNILFLSLVPIYDLRIRNIYTDLIRRFIDESHSVTAVFPSSDKDASGHVFSQEGQFFQLAVRTGQITKKKNVFTKGLSTLLIEHHYIQAIKRKCGVSSFDLVLYVTPPISFSGVVRFCRKKYGAKSYLMLKDIFPQNAVDIGLLPTWGLWKILIKWFKHQEKQLYKLSDYIGCMSPKNVSYLLKNNPQIQMEKVEVCPNSITPLPKEDCFSNKEVKSKSLTFLYGGNLGKPQDIPFLIQCLKDNINKEDRKFIICGTGTEMHLVQSFLQTHNPQNITFIPGLPNDEYEKLVSECDVGMIFLDHRFTIPNFPSRILPYMEKFKPILACTDKNTDIGELITKGNFGWWCESKDIHDFTILVDTICSLDFNSLALKGNNARTYLENNYTVKHTYNTIMKHFT